MAWIYLAVAIVAEVGGTLALRGIADAPRLWAAIMIAVLYAISFGFLALALRDLKVGVVYAIWSAIGIAALSAAGLLFFGESLNWQALLGLAFIVGGVLVLVTSGTTSRV
ncbi:MAG TPA: multidrug efflux SMR transporter [Jatrophihabitantaceae bacterium]|jgi:small multidrug resistance pump|nr:multidrug efflux SMR transporter [Jatrophihabitantaceae bacterium]